MLLANMQGCGGLITSHTSNPIFKQFKTLWKANIEIYNLHVGVFAIRGASWLKLT